MESAHPDSTRTGPLEAIELGSKPQSGDSYPLKKQKKEGPTPKPAGLGVKPLVCSSGSGDVQTRFQGTIRVLPFYENPKGNCRQDGQERIAAARADVAYFPTRLGRCSSQELRQSLDSPSSCRPGSNKIPQVRTWEIEKPLE